MDVITNEIYTEPTSSIGNTRKLSTEADISVDKTCLE